MKISRPLIVGIMCGMGLILWAAPAPAATLPEETAERILEIKPDPDAVEKKEVPPVVSAVALDPQGVVLATAGDDHLVRLWDFHSGTVLSRLEGHTDWVRAVAFRPDGKVLATAGDDCAVRFWDLSSNTPQILPEVPEMIRVLAYSPDGKRLAAAGYGAKVYVYDGVTGALLQQLDAPGGDVRALRYSPDGSRLAAGGRSGALWVWNADGKLRFEVQASSRPLRAVAFSPDGRQIAAAGAERMIRVYDADSGKPLVRMPGQPAEVRSLCYCGPDVLAAGETDNRIRLWSVSTGRLQRQLEGHTGTVAALKYDGPRGELLSAGFDTTIRTWRIVPRQEKVSQR